MELRNKNFGMPFNLVHFTNCRNFSAMFNVMSTEKKLCRKTSRILCHNNALPVDMLAEMVYLFTSHGGSVLDPFSRSMRVSISTILAENASVLRRIRTSFMQQWNGYANSSQRSSRNMAWERRLDRRYTWTAIPILKLKGPHAEDICNGST